jgi:methanogenic corrinoid protein MtbC1
MTSVRDGEDARAGDAGRERLAMLAALVDGDVALAVRIATRLLAEGTPFSLLVDDVLAPVQHDLGARWARGDVGVAEEHAASASVEELLVRLGTVATPGDGARVVVTTAEHDRHQLGARVVQTALALDGFRSVFLGASVPASDLAAYVEIDPPLAIVLSVSIAAAIASAADTIRAAHGLGSPVLVGGRALRAETAARLGADAYAPRPDDAVARLHDWVQRPPALAPDAEAIPEHAHLRHAVPGLVAAALAAVPAADHPLSLADEVRHLLLVSQSALTVEDPALVAEHVAWLRVTAPAHGVDATVLATLLDALVAALAADGALRRVHDSVAAGLQ